MMELGDTFATHYTRVSLLISVHWEKMCGCAAYDFNPLHTLCPFFKNYVKIKTTSVKRGWQSFFSRIYCHNLKLTLPRKIFFFLSYIHLEATFKTWKTSSFPKMPERPCIPQFSLFAPCVTCWCWGSSLEWIRGETVMDDIGMKCTQEQKLCLCWHPVFTETAGQFELWLSGVVRHMTSVLTLRNYHISDACLSQWDASVSRDYELCQCGIRSLQNDPVWLIGWCLRVVPHC